MIPLTVLCKQLLAWAYAIYVEEAPLRRVKALQKTLGKLITTIDAATQKRTLGKSLIEGIVGKANAAYRRLYYETNYNQLEIQLAAANNGISGVHPPLRGTFHRAVTARSTAKAASFGALYGTNPQSIRKTFTADDSHESVLRRARYELFGDNEERLLYMISELKKRYPLEALMLELG